MRCETTSSVKECALRARSNDVHVARVVSLVVDAVVGLHTWSHRSCCCCRFRRSHITLNFPVWEIFSLQIQRCALASALCACFSALFLIQRRILEVRCNLITLGMELSLFIQFSWKTTFVKKHFHPNHFHQKSYLIQEHVRPKTFLPNIWTRNTQTSEHINSWTPKHPNPKLQTLNPKP